MNKIFLAIILLLPLVAIAKDEKKIDRMYEVASKSLAPYRPLYFAYGDPSTKIQLSFRTELSQSFPLNFAYTQVIFWELGKESKPFLDATYNPEFFYRWKINGDRWNTIDFGLWEHNSNGKGGETSRSYDQTYLRLVYATTWRNWILLVAPKVRFIYNIDDTNSNIRDYVGAFEFDFRFLRTIDAFLEKTEVILTLRPGGEFGTNFSKGGYQIAMNFKIDKVDLTPSFYIQYYYGYAESLINFDERVNIFRAGIMF